MRISGAGIAAAAAVPSPRVAPAAFRAPGCVPVAPRVRVPGWNVAGSVADARLTEISGVVASRAHAGTLWVHNDSGDGPRVFAIGADGSPRAEVLVDGANADDWEDISFGPGPAGTTGDWIYVADTGNNFLFRRTLSIYRFAEPSRVGDGRVTAERLDVRFGDGRRHNIEAMFVDPRSGDTMLVTKTDDAVAKLFRIPARPFDGATVKAELVALLEAGTKVTGADISADGSKVAIRTYDHVLTWERGANDTIASALGAAPTRVAAPNSESIAFSPDGGTWFSISEGAGADVATRAVPR